MGSKQRGSGRRSSRLPRSGSAAGQGDRGRLVVLPGGADAGRRAAPAPNRGSGAGAPAPDRRQPRPWIWAWAAAAAGAAAVTAALVAWLPSPAARPATVPVRWGTLDLAWSGTAVAVRHEAVHVSPAAGDLALLVEEGAGVRVGAPVARVAAPGAGPVTVAAERSGAVSFRLDGAEADLSPEGLEWLTGVGRRAPGPGSDWVAGWPGSPGPPPPARVQAGSPVFKVIDTSRLWLAVALPAGQAGGLEPGAPVTVELTGAGGNQVRFTVTYRSPPAGGQVLLGLQAGGPFPGAALYNRRLPVRLILDQVTGWLVPAASLTGDGGAAAVWIARRSSQVPVTVRVLARDGLQAVVEGPLREGQRAVLADSESTPGTPDH